MGTPNKQNNLLVRSPKYSVFDISSDHKFTMPIGKIVPVGGPGIELMPGESLDINLQQLTRFMPLVAPVMQRYILDFVPIFVPYRLLWTENAPIWNAEKFFNPATPDADRPAVPMMSIRNIYRNNDRIFGSVFDYLGYPTLTALYESIYDATFKFQQEAAEYHLDGIMDLTNTIARRNALKFKLSYLGTNYDYIDSFTVKGFVNWICYDKLNRPDLLDTVEPDPAIYLELLGNTYTWSALQNEYLTYLFDKFLSRVYMQDKGWHDLSQLPWLCYHKAVADWFLNTNQVDPDYYMQCVAQASSAMADNGNAQLSSVFDSSYDPFVKASISNNSPVSRLWMDDYFTTAYANKTNDTEVPIPVNGTIQDFWFANRLAAFRQTMQLAGKRFKDTIKALWGYNIPDERLQRSEVLGHLKFNLSVSDVLQTSQSEIDSSLGQFAGQALSANGGHLLHYTAPEPGLVLILCSVRPTTSYVDQVPRLIYRTDFKDWENPAFDNIGMQPIYNREIFYKPNDKSIFGYTPRRYQEFMMGYSSVSGDFKTSLSYWHAARKFSNMPALNSSFIAMNPSDGLDRIFASEGSDNILCQVYLDAKVSRPLSRFINYHM